MRKTSSRIFSIIVVLGFLASWYWVEWSPVSSRALALCNGGYGTFDMKMYDAQIVQSVLAIMNPEGFAITFRYYIGDFSLILFFGLLQCLISKGIFSSLCARNLTFRVLYISSLAIPVIRGLADIVENSLLLRAAMIFPQVNGSEISIASMATKVKFALIFLWVLLILVGALLRFCLRKKRISDKAV